MEDSYEDLFDLESPPVSEILTTLGLKASSMAERVVLIAGGARGIAAQAARGFGHLGARVVIVDKRTCGQQLAEEIRAEGADAYFRLMDLTVDHEIELLTAWLEEQFGQVDVLIHNAVDFEVSAVTELSLAGWDYANNTNVRSAFILISKLLPGMVERSRGTIVTMIAPGGLAFASAMSASKHALRSLTQSLAAELGKDSGVSVMGFAPGLVATEMVREVFPEYCARLQMDFRDYVHGFSHNPGYEGLMPQEHCGASLVHAVVHDDHVVRHGERFFLIVGHEDGGDADVALDRLQLDPHLLAQVGIESRQRLVEEQHIGLDDDGPGQRDALLLTARELRRQASFHTGQAHDVERLQHVCLRLLDVA